MQLFAAPATILKMNTLKDLPDDMSWMDPVFQDVIPEVNLASRSAFGANFPALPKSPFVARFDGKLKVDILGEYILCVSTSGGGRLYLDGRLLASGKGQQCGTVNIIPGSHFVRVIPHPP
jgi:hypothetical protein